MLIAKLAVDLSDLRDREGELTPEQYEQQREQIRSDFKRKEQEQWERQGETIEAQLEQMEVHE